MTHVAQRRENNHEVYSTQRLNLCCFLAFNNSRTSKIAVTAFVVFATSCYARQHML